MKDHRKQITKYILPRCKIGAKNQSLSIDYILLFIVVSVSPFVNIQSSSSSYESSEESGSEFQNPAQRYGSPELSFSTFHLKL